MRAGGRWTLVFLLDLLVIFAVAVAVVMLLRRVGLPPIAGFIVAGVLVGPHVLGLVGDSHQVEVLAEVGVVLLLFGLGMELSLDRLRRLLRPILLGGTLQMSLSVAAVTAVGILFGVRAGEAAFLGFIIAVSSTAIVLRGLESRGEVDAPHGRLTLGILLFQDLSVVPMILAIPFLSGVPGSFWDPVIALAKAIAVLAIALVASRVAVPRILYVVARTRERELFVMTVLLVCLGTAFVAWRTGVSLAVGAFLAGLVVASSEYRHQAISDLMPFREVFTSIFFVSVGMLFDPVALVSQAGPVLGLLGVILVGKFVVIFLVGLLMRLPLRVCTLAGVALCQVGEFSFVLARQGQPLGLFGGTFTDQVITAIILSMFVTPLLLAAGPHIAAGVGRIRVLTSLMGVRAVDDLPKEVRELRDHVIIAGFGLAGQQLAEALQRCGVPHLVVDMNPDNVRRASSAGLSAFFGDVTSPEVLERLGAKSAKEIVLVINDPRADEAAIRAIRRVSPELYIVVRCRYAADIEQLERAGSDLVIAAETEAAEAVVKHVLERCSADRRCAAP